MTCDADLFEALFDFTHYTRFATLRGVTLDLRHPMLDAAEWKTGTLWIDDFEPNLLFPWNVGDVVAQRFRALQRRAYRRHGQLSPVRVYPGNRVSISKIVRRLGGDTFDHPHDAEVRDVYLNVERRNGALTEVAVPIRFFGRTRLVGAGSWGKITFQKIAQRICDRMGIESIHDFELAVDALTLPEAALHDAQALWKQAGTFMEGLPDLDAASVGSLSRESLQDLLNVAVSLGYSWAKAEADEQLRPMAESGRRSREGAGRAGKQSGEARRRKAERTWQPHALQLARLAREQRPTASQDDVVADIQSGWKLVDTTPPGTKTLKAFVSRNEHLGELPRRVVHRRAFSSSSEPR